MARSMTFQVNDASTGTNNPSVSITITENADGTLSFNVSQNGGIVGDLRGLFFDLNNESIMNSLVVSGTSSSAGALKFGDDSVKDLGNGANMNGLTGSDGGFDAGISIGSAGLGSDDVRSFSFTLGSTARSLTLDDFANVDFGVRLTSVGTLGGTRTDSSKLLETTSSAINAADDTGSVDENAAATGNLLNNDANKLGTTTVTAWSGGELGQAVALSNAEGATLTVNADGSWALDASGTDALSEGEALTYTFTYDARSASADQVSSDSATFTVTVAGKNDGPVAEDDASGAIAENASLSGNVTANDSDVDRLDTHTWALVEGSFNGLGNLTFNADGTWSYDAAGAYDGLYEGESVELSFTYAMTDNHGASDTAAVSFRIDGVGTVTPPPQEEEHGGPQGNNGWGNGDQDAPGGSGPNNQAENSDNTDPSHGANAGGGGANEHGNHNDGNLFTV